MNFGVERWREHPHFKGYFIHNYHSVTSAPRVESTQSKLVYICVLIVCGLLSILVSSSATVCANAANSLPGADRMLMALSIAAPFAGSASAGR